MSQPIPDVLAEGVAAIIDAAGLTYEGNPVTATSATVVRWPRKALADLKVVAVPYSDDQTILDRARDMNEIVVHVAVTRQCDPDDADAVKALSTLKDQIKAALRKQALPGDAAGAKWKGARTREPYDPAMLHQQRVYLAILELTYVVIG